MITFTGLLCIVFTLLCYLLGFQLYRKYKKDWLNPLYTAPVILIILLFACHIRGDTYQQGSLVFNKLLELAVVSLAVPLYKQWSFLKKNFNKICSGVVCGTVLGIISVIGLAQIFHLKQQLLASLIPRSVTLPIALTLSNELGGYTTTTVFFVIFSGLVSLTIGPKLLKRLGIRSKAAKGLAMGTSAQMLGANRSLLWGEEEGAMGSVAMTTSALFLSVIVPILPLILRM
ncbi:LrgB family protein [Bacillus canaveralius]|uniref:LrgB family protein n=1 Tax=Bacillus canaveralius TaxID=1403243 RepID=A0A2N5GMQ5_9BACI|nr:LrgB family protein [Bacillus canaveralius]PLR83297.1 LrgB family protein [Bacillus canaveralius]PLR96656.1 LrgB family protein [Bacillus canaveralius]